MDIELTAQLLKEENIISFFTNTSIEQDRKQDENYSKLLKNDEIWGFYFVTCERNSEGNSEKLNKFFDEADACKYYYLFSLSKYYFRKYIFSYEKNNRSLNIGLPSFELSNLKEALVRLKIRGLYYSFNGENKNHSIQLISVNDRESRVEFIGEQGLTVFSTEVLENWLAYYAMYKYVYYLHLLDQKNEELMKRTINLNLTDQDYYVFMT